MVKKEVEEKEFILQTPGGYPLDEVISNLQKCVRRGLQGEAMWWGHELLPNYVAYLWRRLSVIASEDCATNPQPAIVIHCLYENSKLASKDFKGRIEGMHELQAIAFLCQSPKNRRFDDAVVWMDKVKKAGEKREIDDFALDQHTKRGRQMGRGDDFWYRESSKLDNPVGKNEFEERLKKLDGYKK